MNDNSKLVIILAVVFLAFTLAAADLINAESSNKQKFQIDCVRAGGTIQDDTCVKVNTH